MPSLSSGIASLTAATLGRLFLRPIRDFSGLGGDASYLWPRWIVLRAVGAVFASVFLGIIFEAKAVVGPNGIIPAAALLQHLASSTSNPVAAFFKAPGLLWLDAGETIIGLLGWLGMAAALALVLNIWPRLALFICWLVHLSFVSVFTIFSSTQMDQLMLEVAILCIPFAPAGFRPGLGVHSPPWPLALFMVRWLLFRVMFESGLCKIVFGDEHWRQLTAMDIMYETAPFPTIFGYLAHQLPHAYHLFEIALTFVAELVAPLLALFAGRRGRWFALVTWTMLQGGILLTTNFGWLNYAAIGLGLLLLDDQMLAALLRRLRLTAWAGRLTASAAGIRARPAGWPWRRRLLHAFLWLHFALSGYDAVLAVTVGRIDLSTDTTQPWYYSFLYFRSSNAYTLYAKFTPERFGVEFVGSNDGGASWRPYRYPHFPQMPEDICGFIAPRFLRFEATMQVIASLEDRSPTMSLIALKLLERDPRITGLFAADPFADRPATMIRLRRYQLKFTDYATWRRTGHFWTKQYLEDYAPMVYVNAQGQITQAASGLEVAKMQAEQGNPAAQNHLGSLYLTGRGVPKDLVRAEHWLRRAAAQGFAGAQYNLGIMHAEERGNPREAARWFRRAADQGLANAQFALGVLHAQGAGVPHNAVEAFAWYERAALGGSIPARFQLGVCYFRGEGVAADAVEALAWFILAADAGDEDAHANQAVLESRLGPENTQRAVERSRLLRQRITPPQS